MRIRLLLVFCFPLLFQAFDAHAQSGPQSVACRALGARLTSFQSRAADPQYGGGPWNELLPRVTELAEFNPLEASESGLRRGNRSVNATREFLTAELEKARSAEPRLGSPEEENIAEFRFGIRESSDFIYTCSLEEFDFDRLLNVEPVLPNTTRMKAHELLAQSWSELKKSNYENCVGPQLASVDRARTTLEALRGAPAYTIRVARLDASYSVASSRRWLVKCLELPANTPELNQCVTERRAKHQTALEFARRTNSYGARVDALVAGVACANELSDAIVHRLVPYSIGQIRGTAAVTGGDTAAD